MKASEIALKAAQIIAERGLAKGVLEDEQGRVCHNGAVYMAVCGNTKGLRLNDGDREMIIKVIRRSECLLPGGWLMTHQYNDDDSVSAEDVILLLKRNAEHAEHLS